MQYNAIGETTQPYDMRAFAGQSHLGFWPRLGAPANVGQPLCLSLERIRAIIPLVVAMDGHRQQLQSVARVAKKVALHKTLRNCVCTLLRKA
jgi:hypothetical protein